MKKILIILALLPVFISNLTHAHAADGPVHVIPLSGEVGPAMAAFVKRAVNQALDDNAKIIVFQVDTFGGRVDAALEIVETLLTVDKEKSVAYVDPKAISAGALIALSAGRLYMRNNSTIGDCAPISYTNEGVQEMGEKFQSPLRAKFRTLAKRNGFPEVLAETMVSKGKEIIMVKKDENVYFFQRDEFDELPADEKKSYSFVKTVVEENELLTMDDVEAQEYQFSTASVSNIDQLFEILDIDPSSITWLKKTWSETMAGYLIAISPILIMIGMAAVYTELKSPGFGIPGAIGIICLALAFGSHHIAGLASYTELLLVIAGFVLIAVEVFVLPGFGIAGMMGGVFIFAGMVLALQGFTLPNPEFPWEMDLFIRNITWVLFYGMFALLLSVLSFRYILPHVPLPGGGPFLTVTLDKSHADSSQSMRVKAGDTGITISGLRPSGKADFNGNRMDVITQGDFIEPGERVKIIHHTHNKIIVEKEEA